MKVNGGMIKNMALVEIYSTTVPITSVSSGMVNTMAEVKKSHKMDPFKKDAGKKIVSKHKLSPRKKKIFELFAQ